MQMLRKLRRSSRVTLVLAGIAALTACSSDDDQRRDVYKSREDCLADWANKPEDCKPATEPRHASSGFWYGPMYPYRSGSSGNAWTNNARSGSRAVSSSTVSRSSSGVSRGGFGSSARSSGG
jgi:uncharacterized protein YgiB involved in biofilm formation